MVFNTMLLNEIYFENLDSNYLGHNFLQIQLLKTHLKIPLHCKIRNARGWFPIEIETQISKLITYS